MLSLHVSISARVVCVAITQKGVRAATATRCTTRSSVHRTCTTVPKELHTLRTLSAKLSSADTRGFRVCLVSILRLHSLVAISNSPDPTYDNAPAATWSSCEANIGIICSCLPCLRPLITRYFPGAFSTTSSSSRSWYCGGYKYTQPPVRRFFTKGKRVNGNLSTIRSEDLFDLNQMDDRDSIIRVVTEVHVTVEKKRKSEVP